jgi:hypothetical protein
VQKKEVLSDAALPDDIRFALAQNMQNDLFYQARIHPSVILSLWIDNFLDMYKYCSSRSIYLTYPGANLLQLSFLKRTTPKVKVGFAAEVRPRRPFFSWRVTSALCNACGGEQ